MNKPLVIYHDNCADGFAAAWCFYKKFRNDVDYYGASYGQEIPHDIYNRCIYLVDFCYQPHQMEQLCKAAEKVILIDHHVSSLKALEHFEFENLLKRPSSIEHSGAMLAWKYLYGEEKPPVALRHIEDRDMWWFKMPCTRPFMANVFSHNFNLELFEDIMEMEVDDLDYNRFIDDGEAILRSNKKLMKQIIETSGRYVSTSTYNFEAYFVNCPAAFMSDIGDMLSEEYPVIALYYDTQKFRKFSLRSSNKGSVDVSVIAEQFGGGGHKHAAGFIVKRNHFLAQI